MKDDVSLNVFFGMKPVYFCESCGVVQVEVEGIYCDACCDEICKGLAKIWEEREEELYNEAKKYESILEDSDYARMTEYMRDM